MSGMLGLARTAFMGTRTPPSQGLTGSSAGSPASDSSDESSSAVSR